YAYPVFVRLLDRMGTPTQYLCDYWSGWVRLPRYAARMRTLKCWAGSAAESTKRSWNRCEGLVEGVNGNVEGANEVALDFLMIITQQLQNLLLAMLAQVSNQGYVGNQNGNVVNENVQENIGNVIVNGNQICCSYKEFLACNPKEYDGKRGVVVLTRWIEKMESVHNMSGCSIDQKVKYTAGSFVGKDLTWWNSQIRTLSREVAVSMSWNDFKFMMIQEFCPSHKMQNLESKLWNHAMVGAGHVAYTNRFHELARLVPHLATPESRMIEKYIFGALTDEAVRNGSIKKVKNRGNVGKPSKDRSESYDNKRTKIRNVFATTVTLDCRGMPRNVNPVNARNPTVRACYECGKGCCRDRTSLGGSKTKVSFDQVRHLGERWPYLDKFVIVFIDDILIYSKTQEEHVGHFSKTFDWGGEQELEDFVWYFVVAVGMRLVVFCVNAKSDYDCEIRYYLGKANVVAALSRKERVNPKRGRAMNMILQSSIKDKIMAAQNEAVDEFVGLQEGLDKMIEQRSDGTLY
ncbi:reverse transcriptase domain-containing protein, partial [Tanacetum coccineum]